MGRFARLLALSASLGVASILGAVEAQAFCGFYVADANQKLYNNATTVVLMREGTRTVLSMQNNYQGPPENFAMVVPVPVVLQKENVKTLSKDVFDKIDQLASPRLVEYWEQDPCSPPRPEKYLRRMAAVEDDAAEGAPAGKKDHGVKIEAQFKVGEYEIVILSARDSSGLDAWLKEQKYKIPDGSEPLLRPYVQSGSKFFVAKVDVKKVRFEKGMAQLSPLRFHYDSETFSLPVRLGMVNSAGMQDLIVHILANGQRYETANYPNVAIPTNLDVKDSVRTQFPAFYAALFDRTIARHPGAAVTEYSWDASTCDPCPGPALDDRDFATLGQDVLPGSNAGEYRGGMVLTRLHLRYGKDSLGEDLVFRAAPPIVGGREHVRDGGKLETGAVTDSVNNFQARYAIRHPWTGPIKCASPTRGIWGGPPSGNGLSEGVRAARDVAFAPRGGVNLVAMVERDNAETPINSAPLISMPSIPAATGTGTPAPTGTTTGNAGPTNAGGETGPKVAPASGGCAGCHVGADEESDTAARLAAASLLALAWTRLRRNRRDRA